MYRRNPPVFSLPDGTVVPMQTIFKDINRDIVGWVIGAHQVEIDGKPRLIVVPFEASDMRAAREVLAPDIFRHVGIRDFSPKYSEVTFKGSEAMFVARLFRMIRTYMIVEEAQHIPYPRFGGGYNSNSWVQTLLTLAGGTVKDGGDFDAYDRSHLLRIPNVYFQGACCPIRPIPDLNQ